MKWGVRRYQNSDGSLTTAGRRRYYGTADKIQKDIDSFKGTENGIYTKSGKPVLSAKDVSNIVKGLESQRDKSIKKGDLKREKDKKRIDKYNQEKAEFNAMRESRINKQIDKFESKVDKFNAKTMASREKNRAKLERKGKIEKANDFDLGTKAIKSAQSKVKDVVNNYRDMRIKAIRDSSIRKTPEYRNAIARFNEVAGNLPMATLGYAFESAAEDLYKK